MIRKIFLLLLIISPFSLAYGQVEFDSLDKMIKYFSKIDGVQYEIKKTMQMTFPFVEKIDHVESLIVEDCDTGSIHDFVTFDVTRFKGYEVVFKVADDGDVVTLLMKPTKKSGEEKFSELVFVVQEPDEGVLFRLKGLFTKPDPVLFNNWK